MKSRKFWAAIGVVALATGLGLPAANADDSTYLPENPAAQVVDPAFHEADNVVVVDSEANVTPAQSSPSVGSSANGVSPGCPRLNAVFLSSAIWMESTNGCGIIGSSKDAMYKYSWSKNYNFLNVGSDSCVQGRGYYSYVSVGEPRWFNAGCGSSGSAVVNIGNVATVAKIRGITMSTTPSAVYWR